MVEKSATQNIISSETISNEWGMDPFPDWEKQLVEPPQRIFQIKQDLLLPQIGAFGTVADSTWREKVDAYYWLVSDKHRIPYSKDNVIYDPVITGREWTPQDAVNESKHLLYDAVKLHGIERKFSSVGSLAEIGFLAVASLLKGSKLVAFINDPLLEEPEVIQRLKSMSVVDMKYVEKSIPDNVMSFPTLLPAAQRAWEERETFLKLVASPVNFGITQLLLPRNDIEKQVVISGSSKDPDSVERLTLKLAMKRQDLPYVDTVRSDWTIDAYEHEEVPIKENSLVNTVIVSDPTSFGAVKDVGLAVFRAITNGTYGVVYFPSEPTQPKGDYNRARALALSHFKHLTQEYPWIKHYVRFANSIENVSQYVEAIMNTSHPK